MKILEVLTILGAGASQSRMNEKVIKKWAIFGVKVIDPVNTRIDVSVELAEGVTIHPGVVLTGSTRISKNSNIGPSVV